GLGVVDGQLGDTLAIEPDLGQPEPVDQPAVTEPAHLGGGAHAGDEEAAEVALLGAPVAEREHPGPQEGLLGRLEQAPAPSDKALRGLEDPFLPLVSGRTAFGTHRSVLVSRQKGASDGTRDTDVGRWPIAA